VSALTGLLLAALAAGALLMLLAAGRTPAAGVVPGWAVPWLAVVGIGLWAAAAVAVLVRLW
jgi:hypothetical protein